MFLLTAWYKLSSAPVRDRIERGQHVNRTRFAPAALPASQKVSTFNHRNVLGSGSNSSSTEQIEIVEQQSAKLLESALESCSAILFIVGLIGRADGRPDRSQQVERDSAKTHEFSGRVRRPF